MRRSVFFGAVVLILLSFCGGRRIDEAEVKGLVQSYYRLYPYMLAFPEERQDDVRFGGHSHFAPDMARGDYSAVVSPADVEILEVGKPRSDGSVAVKCRVRGQYTRRGKTESKDKTVDFLVAENDFGKTTLDDIQGLRGVVKR